MAEQELAIPLWPAVVDPFELSWEQKMKMGLGDPTADQQFGPLSTIAPQPPLRMEDYLAHDDAMMNPQFGDSDFAKWISELPKGGASNPFLSPEMNNHHQMGNEYMEMKLLLMGHQDETHLPPPVFGRSLDHAYDIHQWEDKFYSAIGDDAKVAEQIHLNNEFKDYIAIPTLIDLVLAQGSWGRKGQRKQRCTRIAYSKAEATGHMFGFLGDVEFERKRNNSHWTSDEVKKLVEGVSKCGVGKWAKVKKAYFKTSFRKATQLKDKWRDLVRACGIDVGSKKKVKAQTATREMLKGMESKIKSIAKSAFR
ncbi:unnamed protein product [Urochloa humidicola]